jgi:hypothetical protein
MPSQKLENYLSAGILEFPGNGIPPELWAAIGPIADLQKSNGIVEPVCEIGVHHGRFIIGLMLIKDSPRKNLAIDVFELQQFNMDRSGNGNYEIFMQNVAKHYGHADRIGTIKGDSIALSHVDVVRIREEYGKFSMFSIDGCHTAEHTYNDLVIAADLTCHGGVILIDDYYNANFPGVQEAVCQYFFGQKSKFAPICFVGGKLFLTDASHHKIYFEDLRTKFRNSSMEMRAVRTKRFGWDTLTISRDFRGKIRGGKGRELSGAVGVE